MLVLINVFDPVYFEQTCPESIPLAATRREIEASHLKRVDHSVVNVRGVVDFKR
jgi:hypothetical protein